MYKDMDQWMEIRRRVSVEGVSKRQILRRDGHALDDAGEEPFRTAVRRAIDGVCRASGRGSGRPWACVAAPVRSSRRRC